MNHERQPEIPKFILNIGEEKLICTPENTLAFLYEDNKYDHVFYVTYQDDEAMHGYHIFRHLLPEDFDNLVMRMIQGGFAVTNEDEITETDLTAFKKSQPDYYELKDPGTEWGNTKQMQAEHWGKFVAYILEQIANKERGDY